jgi:ubiquinol-cytochrome c reductase cytochrome c1 subunit
MLRLSKILTLGALGFALAVAAPAFADRTAVEPEAPAGGFGFEGPFGKFGAPENQKQLQRGYQVYKEVCSNCHSMSLVSFGDLGQRGGPFWNPKYPNPNDNPVIKALAADVQVADIDGQTGEPIKRPGIPADHFPSPYDNATAAAAANGGAAPPDQSTLAKARDGGAEYIYSLLTGYAANPPAGLTVATGRFYNPYFPGDLSNGWNTAKYGPVPKGGVIAMPPPLADGRVTYTDGTKSTLKQQAADVAAFLAWASDPHADERKQLGLAVLIFLGFFAVVTFLSYRAIWKGVDHH